MTAVSQAGPELPVHCNYDITPAVCCNPTKALVGSIQPSFGLIMAQRISAALRNGDACPVAHQPYNYERFVQQRA